MSENCIFCKIIRGDFGTEFVYETENTVVFNDINPKAPVHMQFSRKVSLYTGQNLLGGRGKADWRDAGFQAGKS